MEKAQGLIRNWGKLQLAYLEEYSPQEILEIHKKVTLQKNRNGLVTIFFSSGTSKIGFEFPVLFLKELNILNN